MSIDKSKSFALDPPLKKFQNNLTKFESLLLVKEYELENRNSKNGSKIKLEELNDKLDKLYETL